MMIYGLLIFLYFLIGSILAGYVVREIRGDEDLEVSMVWGGVIMIFFWILLLPMGFGYAIAEKMRRQNQEQ